MEAILLGGVWRAAIEPGAAFRAVDPSTGEAFGPEFPECGAADLDQALSAAQVAAAAMRGVENEQLAAFFEGYAATIDADASTLCDIAQRETGLPLRPRLLEVELPRTVNQLRLAARCVREESWRLPTLDTKAGLRAGFDSLSKPVLVFGPNNFPLAFNAVAGSDFACALIARNPVIAKAHPSHPGTSQRLAQHAHRVARDAGLPDAAIQMIYHLPSALGLRAAGDARLGALGFTGSRTGGLALKAAADAAGVPAYLELSSINPVLMLPGALNQRGAALAQEFFASCTLGAGQFCTNPGLILTLAGASTEGFIAAATTHFAQAAPGVLLNAGVLDHLQRALVQWRAAGATCLAGGARVEAPGFRHQATLMRVDGARFLRERAALNTEAFGPASLVVVAQDDAELAAIIENLEGNLTAAIYCADDGSDEARYARHAPAVRARCGRLLENKMPTGVAVSAAMQHGGPYPATGHPGFSSVGLPGAARRFAAWQSYDNVPAAHLPTWLRDANPERVWRCIDGQWTQADLGANPK